ncbi:MAG: polyprenyl synthetase family protein [Alphaproteobacteria bacterium]|jgi:geranylgeranyl diphosphate synthase type II|nr:polyprenyl synthetase family protein [Alphaproteobacteria bacterium]
MAFTARIETALRASLDEALAGPVPPLLAAALEYAVFPGGARVRPSLLLAVAAACGDDAPALADAAACAVELLHCASLAHDDLPCFDDADLRRGLPSVHRQFGVPTALLAGDALIVLAFETIAKAGAERPLRLPALLGAVARGVGAPAGIVAGQAWEQEPTPSLQAYHSAKTGALFMASTMAGAIAAGADPGPWRALGDRLGAAYQVADDLLDAMASEEESGKSAGRDVALSRPSAARELGLQGAADRLDALVAEAAASVPACPGAKALREIVRMQAARLVPKQLARNAA